jgi:hypothetical protein
VNRRKCSGNRIISIISLSVREALLSWVHYKELISVKEIQAGILS